MLPKSEELTSSMKAEGSGTTVNTGPLSPDGAPESIATRDERLPETSEAFEAPAGTKYRERAIAAARGNLASRNIVIKWGRNGSESVFSRRGLNTDTQQNDIDWPAFKIFLSEWQKLDRVG